MTRKNDKQNVPDLKVLMVQNHDLMQPLMQWLLQEVLEQEMTDLLGAAKGERCEARQGYRSGYYPRRLLTRVGTMELRVPQDRQARFSTQFFEATSAANRAERESLPEAARRAGAAAPRKTFTFYRLPQTHHKHLKSTNLLERFHQELKRRSLVVRIFPNEQSCLRLIRALAAEQHEEWLDGAR